MTVQNTLGTTAQALLSLDVPAPTLELSNTEKQMLINLAHEAGPLGKVLRYFHDYGGALRQSLANADLDDPETMKTARKVQATMNACGWVLDQFQSVLTLTPEPGKETP